MTEAEIYAALTPIFRETLAAPSLTLRSDMTARDVEGWDSLKMVMIIMAVEERFDIRMQTRDMDALRCVGDFVALIGRANGG